MKPRWAGALLGAALGVMESLAIADPNPPKRPVPAYSGRVPRPATPGDVALWVPRVLFSPVYFVSEFVIRRPLGLLVTAAERANVPAVLYDFFAFGPDHQAGVAPTLFVDFGFNPSVGLYGFWNDAFFQGDDLRAHVAGWNRDWLAASLTQRIRFHRVDTFTLRFAAIRRPDYVFYGTGPASLQSLQSRYGEDLLDGGVAFALPLWRASRVEMATGIRYANLYDGHFGRDPSLLERVQSQAFALPDDFPQGYSAVYDRLQVAIDSRRSYPAAGSGFRLDALAEQGSDFARLPAAGWLRYQGSYTGALDLDGYRRVLSVSFAAIFSDPLGVRPVPFTELASLGGDAPMAGFFPGRLVDRSAAVATLHYRWPIGPWLSGSMQTAVGNVFAAHLENFAPRLLRLSATLGIESDVSPDSNVEIVLGMGTETFDHGGQVDSFRLAFGTTRL